MNSRTLKAAFPALPPGQIAQNGDSIRILIPLAGVDLRQIYVIASARSISVELRKKYTIDHPGICVREVQHQHIVRDLKFECLLKRRATGVRMLPGHLEITCVKASGGEDGAWSEFVHFDSRASLGGV